MSSFKSDPAHGGFAIVPSDSAVFYARSLYVGTTGDLAVRFVDGSTVVLKAVAIDYHPLEVDKVLATGTTAANIIGLR